MSCLLLRIMGGVRTLLYLSYYTSPPEYVSKAYAVLSYSTHMLDDEPAHLGQ